MKYNQKHTTRIYRKQSFDIPEITAPFEDMIFPFEVKTGFVNTTEKGLTHTNEITSARFERIFTGFEAISMVWEGSTAAVARHSIPVKLHKTYKPGIAIPVLFDSQRMDADFEAVAYDNDYTKEKVVTTVELYSKHLFSKIDEFKLYVMPGRYEDEIFYIHDVEEYFDKNDPEVLIYSKLTLKSMNDRLANSGLAIDQYIQFAAPGEGYAWPLIVKGIDEYTRRDFANVTYNGADELTLDDFVEGATFLLKEYLHYGETIVKYIGLRFAVIANVNKYVLDTDKLANNPIVSAQLEVYGPGILSSVYAYGRPIGDTNNSNEEVIEKPRLLLPAEMQGTDITQRAFNKPLSQSTAYYWLPRSRMEIESFYKDWTEKVQGDWNPAITKKWLGYLRIVTKDYGSAQPNLAWRIFTDIFSAGLAEIAYNQPDRVHPANGYQELKGVQTLPKLLANGYFTHRNAPRLPMTYKESIPWTFKNVPLVGGWLAKATFGLPIGWKNQKDTGGRNYNVTGIIPGSLLDFYKNTFIGVKTETVNTTFLGSNKQDYTAIPFDGLSDKAPQSALSPGETATVINFTLSDRFYENTHDPNTYGNEGDISKAPIPPTQDLQFTDEHGDVYPIHNTVDLGVTGKAKYRVSSAPAAKPDSVPGYAIDAFGFHFLGEADWKITLFDANGNVQFSGTYKTLSKLTGSIRDWNTNLKLSHWEGDEVVDEAKYDLEPAPSLPADTKPSLNLIDNGILYPVTKLTLNMKGSVASLVDLNALTNSNFGDRYEVRATGKLYEWNGASWVDKGLVTDNFQTVTDANGKPIFEYDERGVIKVNTIASLNDRTAESVHNYDLPTVPTQYAISGNGVWSGDFVTKGRPTVAFNSFFNTEALKTLYAEGFRRGVMNYGYKMEYEYLTGTNRDDDPGKLHLSEPITIDADGTISHVGPDKVISRTFSDDSGTYVKVKTHAFEGYDGSQLSHDYRGHVLIRELILHKVN